MFKRFLAGLSKSKAAPGPSIQSLQDDVVRAVAGDITNLYDGEWEGREWVHIAVNHEILVEEGQRSSTQTTVLARKAGGPLEDMQFRLSQNTKAKLLELRNAMAGVSDTHWTITDIAIERDGHYDFAFSYGPPPRIGGDLLHSPLKGALERYKTKWGVE